MLLFPLMMVLAQAPVMEDLPRAGLFGAGFNMEPVSIGPMQAFTRYGSVQGASLSTGVQIDLGTRWALRIHLEGAGAASTDVNFAEFGLAPGILYRWRDTADQRWVPYGGAGLKFGGVGASRGILGLESAAVSAMDFDWDDFDDNNSNPDEETRFGTFPEVFAGVEWHPNRWFALTIHGSYTYARLVHTNVHMFQERVGVRFSL
ncbi:hypothetical protein JGU66_19090 [Myxococcaceae bacterium JPH2]|nr:hypothetical protein [Myxococcaceae bacterium JPH2]